MPQLKEISISIGRTFNVGDYESVRTDVGMIATLAPGESNADVFRDMYQVCRQRLDEYSDAEIKRHHAQKRDDGYEGGLF